MLLSAVLLGCIATTLVSTGSLPRICSTCACSRPQEEVTSVVCTNHVQHSSTKLPTPQLFADVSPRLWLTFRGLRMARPAPISGYPAERLSLEQNGFETLPSKMFANMTRLTSVSLARNLLRALQRESFPGDHRIEVLDLSFNVLEAVDFACFTDMPSLTSLDLHSNVIAEFEPSSKTSSLVQLNLANNVIFNLPMKALAAMPRLERLNMSHNLITKLPDDLFEAQIFLLELDLSFNRLILLESSPSLLPSLTHLHMQHNNLSTSLTFAARLGSLTYLDVSNNPQIHFSSSIWNSPLRQLNIQNSSIRGNLLSVNKMFINLKKLDAGWNYLTAVDGEVMLALEELILDGNSFSEWLPSKASGGTLRLLSLCDLPHLTRLGANSFTGMFAKRGNGSCPVLRVSRTSLSSVDAAAFSGVDWCQVELKANKLKTLPKHLLNWTSLERLDLQQNPWQCDCSLQWVMDDILPTIYNKNQELLEEFRCSGPQEVHGKRLVHWLNATLCVRHEASPSVEVTIGSSIGMLVVDLVLGSLAIALVLAGFALHRRELRRRRSSRNRRLLPN